MGLSDLEQPDIAAMRIERVLSDLTRGDDGTPSAYSPSQRMTLAALQLQKAFRLREARDLDAARRAADSALQWLPEESASAYDVFPVSKGISWDAIQVQRDVVHSIRSHLSAMRAHLERLDGGEGRSWVDVVRSRTGWVDMRLNLASAERDATALRDEYERAFERVSGTRYFGRVTADSFGYEALIVAELAGHAALVDRARERLGQIILLDQRGRANLADAARVREALRLLRQAGATKTLQSALSWVRNQGPTSALIEDARVVIERATRGRWCTETDLLLLESAAEFLSAGEREGAIDAAFVALHREREGNASWSVYDRVWKAVLRLLPTTAAHNRVAKEALQTLSDEGDRALPLANTLARTADVIEWGQVSTLVQSDWRGWRARADIDDNNRALVEIIDRTLNKTTPDLSDEAGILRAASLADNGLPDGADPDTLSEAVEAIVVALDKERKAAPGVMFFGGPAASNVAAAFALRFDNQRVWKALTEFLLDPAVHGAAKALALDRIAGQIGDVPASVSAAIKDGFAGLEGSVRSEHFGTPEPPKFFAEAIRVGILVEAISRERALNVVLELAASNVRDRIEAAKTIPFAIMSGDPTWGHVLLLQLSHDLEPFVRAEAGRSLVRSLGVDSGLVGAVFERIIELLKSDGVRVPLSVLHGLQAVAESQVEAVTRLLPVVRELAESGSNSVVRGAADIVLGLAGPEYG
jgi:hypothetical protein